MSGPTLTKRSGPINEASFLAAHGMEDDYGWVDPDSKPKGRTVMKKFAICAYLVSGAPLLVIGIGTLTAGRASAQYPIINSKVRVINKDSEAIPVKLQGNSSIQGTVKLDSTGNTVKAVQEGAGTSA